MSVAKLVILVVWGLLFTGFFMDSSVSPWLQAGFALMALAHVGEFFAFRKVFEQSGGSPAGHFVQTLVFGMFHIQGVRAAHPDGAGKA